MYVVAPMTTLPALSAASFGSFMHQGQICMSVEKIVLHEKIAAEFTERFVEHVRGLKMGDPQEPGNIIGPIINQKQLDKISGQVDDAVKKGAKLLVHDTTYTAEEYDHHRGWGHSTYDDALTLAIEAGVETLVLFHHKPERSDDELDKRVAACREIVKERGVQLEIEAAAEGMTLTV